MWAIIGEGRAKTRMALSMTKRRLKIVSIAQISRFSFRSHLSKAFINAG
jgi:hypothetical protein